MYNPDVERIYKKENLPKHLEIGANLNLNLKIINNVFVYEAMD